MNGQGLGRKGGQTSGYFLASVASGYFRFISGYVLTLIPRYLDLPALMTGLPWRRMVLHQDGSWRVSDWFPGALGRNRTHRTGRCNLHYGLDLSPYLLPAIIVKLLTELGKIEQTAKARM